MSKTYRKNGEYGHSARNEPVKRPKEVLRHQIDEEIEDLETIKRRQSPLYDWECRRRENAS